MSHRLRAFVLLAAVWLLGACVATIPDDSREHIVMFDRDGWPIDPVAWRKSFFGSGLRMEPCRFDEYVEDNVLAGLERWRERYPEAAAHLEPADVLVDAMRGRHTTWTRIRINLQHVPPDLRPAEEPRGEE